MIILSKYLITGVVFFCTDKLDLSLATLGLFKKQKSGYEKEFDNIHISGTRNSICGLLED